MSAHTRKIVKFFMRNNTVIFLIFSYWAQMVGALALHWNMQDRLSDMSITGNCFFEDYFPLSKIFIQFLDMFQPFNSFETFSFHLFNLK